MPWPNRVSPRGDIVSVDARGTLWGNRGGCLHDDAGRIVRTQASRAWITCLLEYKGRWHPVMPPGRFTELFFLDEATALAAGHRPCFQCRYADAMAFAGLAADRADPDNSGPSNPIPICGNCPNVCGSEPNICGRPPAIDIGVEASDIVDPRLSIPMPPGAPADVVSAS